MEEEQILIWKYLDGECSEAEKKALEARFFTDPAFKQEWERSKAIHGELKQQQPEQPSMRFSASVLERVFQHLPSRPVKDLLPKSFLRWMAGLGSTATAVLGWAAVNVAPATHSQNRYAQTFDTTLSRLMEAIPYSTLSMLTIAAASLLVLYGFDKGLARLRKSKG